ncbi:MAG TPA: 6,7-dimethyl-8-ribityllumazine synthase [Xanthomonadaceae bacterium]|nr:6,7-dimethyl-8-ribityllumazine synthase [Xanthomonadaceae bacterium]
MSETIEGGLAPPAGRIALVASRFNGIVVEGLLRGAREALARHGVADERILVAWVPGAWEIPLVAQRLAAREDVFAVVALGCVIRGETYHFEQVADIASRGIARVALDTGKPVANAILTVYDQAQAEARAAPGQGNKGGEAVLAALETASLLGKL